MKRETWTFEPAADVASLLKKAMNRLAGRGANQRGLRTKILNDALRMHLAALRGKREG